MDTERPSPRYSDIDVWEPSDIAEAMIEGQFTAVAAVRAARFALVAAALAAEARLRNGGRLVYVGAGTSGQMLGRVKHYKTVPLVGMALAIGAVATLAWRAGTLTPPEPPVDLPSRMAPS